MDGDAVTRLLPLLLALLAPACGADGDPVDPSLLGLFHRHSGGSPENLEIAEDRSFRWAHDHCDLLPSEAGRWRPQAAGLALLPAKGEEALTLGPRTVSRLEVRPGDASGEIRVTATTDAGAESQTWSRGGLCSDCGRGGGASGPDPTPCDDPYLGPE